MQDEVRLGYMNNLEIVDLNDQGAFVDAKDFGSLFVPRRQLPKDCEIGHFLNVFLYIDNQRVYATARHPYFILGQTGKLKVTSLDCGTAYLDLGIPKELIVPVSEQRGTFEVGRDALVLIAMDEQGRLFGTQRFNKYIEDKAPLKLYKNGDKVRVVAVSHTPLGYRVIVDDKYYGLIYKNDIVKPISIGKRLDGFILNARDDGKLDITLNERGREGIEKAAFSILSLIERDDGVLYLSDKSDPSEIERVVSLSKGKFKKAIGHLYKQQYIIINDDCLKITEKGLKALDKKD